MFDIKAEIEAARREGRATLEEGTAKRLLSEYGVATPRGVTVGDRAAAVEACETLTAPYVVKAVSRDVIHKSDIGAVRLNLADAAAVGGAIDDIASALNEHGARVERYLIEEMAPAGKELVVGGIVDPQFGPLIMVGLGGVFVEVFEDVAFRICPIDERDAGQMLDELRAAPILAGARGEAPIDRQRAIDALCAIGGAEGLLHALKDEIIELDVNPLIVSTNSAVAADARIVLADIAATSGDTVVEMSDAETCDYFAPLFAPRRIAVVGASSSTSNRANGFIAQLREFGYAGEIYPVHPSAPEIEGLPAYPSLGETPAPVDYAYVAIPAAAVAGAIGAANGRVGFAHILSAGFGETEAGLPLQDALCAAAKDAGVRLLGPNCNGGYSPRGRLTFTNGASREAGEIGVFTQSGGLGIDIVRRGKERGLRFSGVMTIGNCADLGPADLLSYYLADPNTRVIGMYLEGVREGRRFFELLRRAKGKKPVVILKGGRTALGSEAALSHTGALAADSRIWRALSRQTGVIIVNDLESFIDALLGFQMTRPRRGKPAATAALFGNGGGTSVLAVDVFAEQGIEVTPFRDATRRQLEAMNLPPGTSIVNPIDAPVGTLRQDGGALCEKIIQIVQDEETLGAFVLHFNLPVMWSHFIKTDDDLVENVLASAKRIRDESADSAHFLIVLRSDGRPDIDERKRQCRQAALAQGFPVYDELTNAAGALSAICRHEAFLNRQS